MKVYVVSQGEEGGGSVLGVYEEERDAVEAARAFALGCLDIGPWKTVARPEVTANYRTVYRPCVVFRMERHGDYVEVEHWEIKSHADRVIRDSRQLGRKR